MTTENFKKVKQVLWVILFANLIVAFLKITIGALISSASMTADGFHSLTDGTSNVVGLIGIKLASKPVDEDHPYGHKKFETLAGMFIAVMLLFIAGKIIINGVNRFINPATPEITLQSILALFITLIINIFVCKFEYSAGKKLHSQILISDSLHTKSDIYVSVGVLLTLTCVKLGAPSIIDPIVSLIVSGFILHASYEIFNETIGVLVDKVAVDTNKIRDIALSFSSVKDAHKIRSRGREDEIYVDLHVVLESSMSVVECHTLIRDIEKKMQQELNKNVQVIIHIEPYGGTREALKVEQNMYH